MSVDISWGIFCLRIFAIALNETGVSVITLSCMQVRCTFAWHCQWYLGVLNSEVKSLNAIGVVVIYLHRMK